MNFYQQVIVPSPVFHSEEAINDTKLLHPVMLYLVNEVIADAKDLFGVDLMIFETYRSQERQALLFQRGVTKLEHVGVHHYGLAADMVVNKNGEASWDWDFRKLCELAHKHGLISGNDWGRPDLEHSFIDPDHVQFCSVARQDDLFSGSWYPDANYRPYLDLHKERP